MSDFDKAVEGDSHYAMAYNNRGVAKYQGGDLAGAVADFARAIKINSRYAEAYSNRGFALVEQGKTTEADRDFTKAIALKPSMKLFIDTRLAATDH